MPDTFDTSHEQIEILTGALIKYLVEEADAPLPPIAGSPELAKLAGLVEQLRQKHHLLVDQNEAQTIGEGATELRRRKDLARIASVFDESVGSLTRDLVKSGDEGSEATKSVFTSVSEVVDASQQIGETIQNVIEKANDSEASVRNACQSAEAAISAIDTIQTEVKKIVSLVESIESIAFQTNILAINAAIEAARAGNLGKGFAVVANEVKQLSTNTTSAAGNVRTTVMGMNQAVSAISKKVEMILAANTDVSSSIDAMAEAVNSQKESTQRIQNAASEMSTQTKKFEVGVGAIQGQAKSLYGEAERFVQIVSTEPGVSDDEVVFGQSAPFSGAAKSLGKGISAGIMLAFKEAEAAGGIHGRRPVLRAVDDHYDPNTALTNVRKFIRNGEVFGLVGAVGTPTSKLSERIARGGRVPFVGPVTGSGILRGEDSSHVINIRASYVDEASALVDYAASRGGLRKPALFYQADAYGLAVRDALSGPLSQKRTGLEVLAPYDRETGDISEALKTILENEPDTIFMAGTAKITAQFIKSLRQANVDADLLTISFVDADALSSLVGPDGADVVISQVVPSPSDPASDLIKTVSRLNRIHRIAPKIGFAMVEGFVIGRTVCETLQRNERDLTREGFLSTISGQRTQIQIADFPLTFGPKNNCGSNRVYLTQMTHDGKFLNLPSGAQRSAVA